VEKIIYDTITVNQTVIDTVHRVITDSVTIETLKNPQESDIKWFVGIIVAIVCASIPGFWSWLQSKNSWQKAEKTEKDYEKRIVNFEKVEITIEKVVEIWNKKYGNKFEFENDNKIKSFGNKGHYALKMRGGKPTIRFCTTENCKNLQQLFDKQSFDKLPSGKFKSWDEVKNIINPKFPEIQKLIEKKQGKRWEWWPIFEGSSVLNFIMLLDNNNDIVKIAEEIKEFIDATYVPFCKELGFNPNP